MDRHIHFLSWNVEGLNHPVKRQRVLSHIKQLKTDIAFLQETHVRGLDNERILTGWRGQQFHCFFQAKVRGVSVLIGPNISFEPHKVVSDKFGRYVIVSWKLFNTLVMFVNVYAPNLDYIRFFKHLFSLFSKNMLLCLEVILTFFLDQVPDRSSNIPSTTSKPAVLIQAFLSDYGICDVWRTLHPNDRDHFFFTDAHNTYSRIYYFFLDDQLMSLVQSCTYQSIVFSNHAPIAMRLSLPGIPQGSQRWRLNSTFLSDENFVKFIEEISFFPSTNISPDISN